MAKLVGVLMVLAGLLMLIFHRGASGFINESDAIVLQGRRRPMGKSSPLSVLLSGAGLLLLGLWILWKSFG